MTYMIKPIIKSQNSITILNLVGVLTYQGINFLLTPFLTRALGTAEYGIITVYTTWVNILVPVLGLSTLSAIPHVFLLIDKERKDEYISSLLGLSLVTCIGFSIVFLVFIQPISSLFSLTPLVFALLLIQTLGMICVNFAVAYYIQSKRPYQQFALTISVALISFILSLVLIYNIQNEESKYLGRIIGFAVPNVIAGILVIFLMLRKSRKFFIRDVWRYALPICLPTIFHNLSIIILSQSNRLMLQYMVGLDAVGLYGFIYTVTSILSVIWLALNNAWAPFYMEYIKNGEHDIIKKKTKGYCLFYTIMFVVFVLLLPEIGDIFGGEKYRSVVQLSFILALGFYFIFLYSFAVNYKTISKKTLSIASCTVICAVLNILLNYFLIPLWGITGSAIATLISYLALFLLHHYTAAKLKGPYKYTHNLKDFLPWILMAVAGCVCLWFFMSMVIIRWGIALVLGVFLLIRIIRQRAFY